MSNILLDVISLLLGSASLIFSIYFLIEEARKPWLKNKDLKIWIDILYHFSSPFFMMSLGVTLILSGWNIELPVLILFINYIFIALYSLFGFVLIGKLIIWIPILLKE